MLFIVCGQHVYAESAFNQVDHPAINFHYLSVDIRKSIFDWYSTSEECKVGIISKISKELD